MARSAVGQEEKVLAEVLPSVVALQTAFLGLTRGEARNFHVNNLWPDGYC